MGHRNLWAGLLASLLAAFVWAGANTAAQAQALVLNGEEIADAKLFADAKKEGKLTVYSTYPTENMQPIIDQFQKDTGLQLDYIRLATSIMYDRVLAEFGAGRLGADYIDLTDLTLIRGWMDRGILASYKVAWFDKFAPELRDDQARWYYLVRPIQTIGVNTALVQPGDEPKSWKDTLDPKWKGKIGIPAISAGGSGMVVYHLLRTKAGPNAWEKLMANEPRIQMTAAPVQNDLARGRTAIAYVGGTGILQEAQKGAPLKIIFPEEGLAAFGCMGNVTTTATHPNAAKVWVSYLVSKYGSTLVSQTGSYGTHPDSPPPEVAGVKFPPQSQVFNVSIDTWNQIADTYPKEWKAIFQPE